MKWLLIYCISFVICLSEQGPLITQKQREYFNEQCIKKTGVNRKMIDEALSTAILPENEPTYEDYLTCYYKKQGYQSEDNSIIYENVQEFLENFYTRNQADYAVNNCRDLKGTSPGNICYVFLKCLLNNLLELETKQTFGDDVKENEIEVR